MKIGTVDLDTDILVIAEIGNNHEGDRHRAEEMIYRAAEAGVQAVKFQTIIPEELVRSDQQARLDQLRKFLLSEQEHQELAALAEQQGVMFLSTPFGFKALQWLLPLVPALKIASGDNNFIPFLDAVADTDKPILLSTGMSNLPIIDQACATISARRQGRESFANIVLLHCVSAYPTSVHDANLAAIATLKSFGYPVGYSDHTVGISAAPLSVAFGARVIEKHFTLSRTQSDFRDHQLSVEPYEMAELVVRVNEANLLLGSGTKQIQDVEKPNTQALRRSICTARALPAGHQLVWSDFTWLRPSDGVPPGSEETLLGRSLRHAMVAGECFTLDHLE